MHHPDPRGGPFWECIAAEVRAPQQHAVPAEPRTTRLWPHYPEPAQPVRLSYLLALKDRHDFVHELYRHLLARPPDTQGLHHHVQRLTTAQTSAEGLIHEFCQSQEGRRKRWSLAWEWHGLSMPLRKIILKTQLKRGKAYLKRCIVAFIRMVHRGILFDRETVNVGSLPHPAKNLPIGELAAWL